MDNSSGGAAPVMPGDKVGVEEEFMPAENTFVDDDGVIRSAVVGHVQVSGGKISVHSTLHDVRKIEQGMMVLGTVTDDLHSVVFVRISNFENENGEHVATKDGKIIMDTGRPSRGGRDGRGGRGRPRPGEREAGRREEQVKLCGVGDIVLARVLFDDPDVYTLGVREPETGVIHAECEMCGGYMKHQGAGHLVCTECEHAQNRKVSSLYGNADEIKRLFKEL